MSSISTRGIPSTLIRTWPGSSNDKKNAQVTLNKEQLDGIFRRFDKDGDGCLCKKELNQAFNSLGSKFPAWRAWRALCHADANGDGYIDKNEFNDLVNYALEHGYTMS